MLTNSLRQKTFTGKSKKKEDVGLSKDEKKLIYLVETEYTKQWHHNKNSAGSSMFKKFISLREHHYQCKLWLVARTSPKVCKSFVIAVLRESRF